MADAPPSPKFAYTGSGFWGGSYFPYWSLMLVTVVGGLFGLDHFMLRSPTTALLKMFVNFIFLGAWWFYDMIQVYGDKEKVLNSGLSIPFFGAEGIGAGMFTDNHPDGQRSKSPLRWYAFMLATPFVFGIDSFIAGDSNGAIAKFLSTIIPIFWPILIIWKIVDIVRAYFFPEGIFRYGIYRMFPWSWFMEAYGSTQMSPSDPLDADPYAAFGPLGLATALVVQPVVEGVIEPVSSAVGAVAGTVETAANSASAVMNAATATAVPVVQTAATAARIIPKVAAAAPVIANAVLTETAKASNPAAFARFQAAQNAAAAAKAAQVGGGLIGGATDGILSDGVFLFILALLFGGGMLMGALRLKDRLEVSHNARASRDDKPPESPRL